MGCFPLSPHAGERLGAAPRTLPWRPFAGPVPILFTGLLSALPRNRTCPHVQDYQRTHSAVKWTCNVQEPPEVLRGKITCSSLSNLLFSGVLSASSQMYTSGSLFNSSTNLQ